MALTDEEQESRGVQLCRQRSILRLRLLRRFEVADRAEEVALLQAD
jgi:hypothetical protein